MSAYSDLVIAHGASNYWRLGETSGTTAVDVVGGKNGTISGGVTLNQPGAIADGNKAMAFNGTTGKIVTAATILFSATTTIELWMKATNPGDYLGAFSNRTGTSSPLLLCGSLGNKALLYSNPQQFSGTKIIGDGQWHHVVWVLTTTTVNIYVDGVVDLTTTWTPAASVAGVIGIGFDGEGNTFWPGSIDDVAIYPVTLTPAQIAAHYAASKGSTRRPDLPFWSLLHLGGMTLESFNVWRPLTPSDTVDFKYATHGIWVGGGGDVAVVQSDNAVPVVFTAVPAGAWLPLAARRINATATTATNLIGLYQI